MNVWVGGTFDLVHPGHCALLKEAGRLAGLDGMRPGRFVTVAVNTDEFVASYRGRPPVQSLTDRMMMIAAMRWVNEVQVNDGSNQPGLILAADADIVLVGDDWQHRDYLAQIGVSQAWLSEHHVDIRYLPRVGGHSSTDLKASVRNHASAFG